MMIVYSKKIVRFLKEIKDTIKFVLSKEIGLKVAGERFYDQRQKFSYPIKVVIFNNKNMLGYFNADFFEIGLHESLMHSSKQHLHHVIRHELAHYLTFIIHGDTAEPHGVEFRAFCQKLGWGEEIYKATSCLEKQDNLSEIEESHILRKIQKLMALANSSNRNEAEQAMIKSQQLLLKHHLEAKYLDNEEEEKIFLKRIMKQKKENAKMRSIARILETFFVNIVYARAGDFIYLEILGSAVNIEIAEYVANVLNFELDNLWNQAKAESNLKGTVAKNSFFQGLAKGYCSKIQALKREYNSDISQALIVLEKKLVDAKAMVYKRLSSTRSSGNFCQESASLGEKMGRKLTINPAINKSSHRSEMFIAYSG